MNTAPGIGQYELVRPLGQGGMGVVYLALDRLAGGRTVAIKVLWLKGLPPEEQAEARDLFQMEAGVLSLLEHPGIVRAIDYFEWDEQPCLVLEYVEGQTLHEMVRTRSELPSVMEVLGWADQILSILDYLPSRTPPLIVRDLKPANLMLTPDGVIRMIDFGLARHIVGDARTRTFANGYATPGYSPLEQLGSGQTDTRSDLYALGGTLYYLLTGEQPIPSVQRAEGASVLQAPELVRPGVPAWLSNAVMKLMALRVQDRYQTVKEAMQALMEARPGVDSIQEVEPEKWLDRLLNEKWDALKLQVGQGACLFARPDRTVCLRNRLQPANLQRIALEWLGQEKAHAAQQGELNYFELAMDGETRATMALLHFPDCIEVWRRHALTQEVFRDAVERLIQTPLHPPQPAPEAPPMEDFPVMRFRTVRPLEPFALAATGVVFGALALILRDIPLLPAFCIVLCIALVAMGASAWERFSQLPDSIQLGSAELVWQVGEEYRRLPYNRIRRVREAKQKLIVEPVEGESLRAWAGVRALERAHQ